LPERKGVNTTMKKTYLILILVFSIAQLHAQSFEFSVQANSGVSRFVGKGTVDETFIDGDPTTHTGYANGTGNSIAATYGIDLQGQQTFKSNFILGLQAGFETFGGRTKISDNSPEQTGYTTTNYDYVNVNPYVGYRFKLGNSKLDLLPGFDIGFHTGSSYSVNVDESGGDYYNKSGYVNNTTPTEVRLRFGLAWYYHHFGITASYAYGLTNLNNNEVTTVPVYFTALQPNSAYTPPVVRPIHEEMLRLGLSYRIK
jgi:hypothetical protein